MYGRPTNTDLHPVPPPSAHRVVVVSSDRRFARLTAFLLCRRGMEATWVGRLGDLVAAGDGERPDIAILDTSDSLGVTVEAVATLRERFPGVEVIAVTDVGIRRSHAIELRLARKWSEHGGLVAEIEGVLTRLPRPTAS